MTQTSGSRVSRLWLGAALMIGTPALAAGLFVLSLTAFDRENYFAQAAMIPVFLVVLVLGYAIAARILWWDLRLVLLLVTTSLALWTVGPIVASFLTDYEATGVWAQLILLLLGTLPAIWMAYRRHRLQQAVKGSPEDG